MALGFNNATICRETDATPKSWADAVKGVQCAGIDTQDSVDDIIDGIGCVQKIECDIF